MRGNENNNKNNKDDGGEDDPAESNDDETISGLSFVTTPLKRPSRCAGCIVEQMHEPTNQPTDQPSNQPTNRETQPVIPYDLKKKALF